LLAAQDSMVFAADGRIIQEKHPGGLTLGEQILGSLGTLHFGWFGGVAVRIAYGLLGIALCVVTSSGIHVWLARRRDKGRAAPHWERIWAAILWGNRRLWRWWRCSPLPCPVWGIVSQRHCGWRPRWAQSPVRPFGHP
jgi:uncharacterized iron-regulated membrane protein